MGKFKGIFDPGQFPAEVHNICFDMYIQCAITIKWALLQSLAMRNCSIVLKHGYGKSELDIGSCLAGYFSVIPRLLEVQSP